MDSPNRSPSRIGPLISPGYQVSFRSRALMPILAVCFVSCVSSIIYTQHVTFINEGSYEIRMDDDEYTEVMEKKSGLTHKLGDYNGDDDDDQENVDKIKRSEPLPARDTRQKVDDIKDIDENFPNEERRRMNVLILYPDDWRHNSIGAENSLIKTPFLDSLAAGGMRFRQNCATTAICWQSRATLFSGQWASRHRSLKLRCPHFTVGKAWNATWPAILQRDGYFVGHVGKWQYHNADMGKRFDWQDLFEGRHWYGRNGKMIAGEDLARDRSIAFLNERPKDKPFALTVAFYPPKAVGGGSKPGEQWTPKNDTRKMYDNITVPEPYNHTHAYSLLPFFLQRGEAVARWKQRFSTQGHYQAAMKNIYSLITQVDRACKEIVDELKRQGLYNNTMVIFTSDHGMFHGSHGLAGKWYPYQESIRTPMIIYDPRMPADKIGTLNDDFTLNVDLAETILGAAGLKPHERMQGRDISDLYMPNVDLEENPWREEFFYEFTFLDEHYIPSSNALVRKDHKYIDWYHYEHEQLFDLEKDPLELTDVKDDPEKRAIAAEMKARMIELRDSLKEPDIGCEIGGYTVDDTDAPVLSPPAAGNENDHDNGDEIKNVQ